MSVLDTIKDEHREVSDLFDEAEKCEPGDERIREIAQQIEQKLSLHAQLEEKLFYPELRDRAEEADERVDVFEAYTEHAVAKDLLRMIASGRKSDEKFKAELQVLGESVKHHIKEEESTIFKLAHEYLDDEELSEMGEAWDRSKTRAQRAAANGTRKTTARKKSVRGSTGGTRKKTTRR